MGKETQKVNAERKRQCYSKEFKLTAIQNGKRRRAMGVGKIYTFVP